MSLKQNGRRLQDQPLRFRGGSILSFEYQETNKSQLRNMFVGDGGIDPRNGIPAGHLNPSSWVLPQKSGGMSSFTGIASCSKLSANGAMGINVNSSIETSSSFLATGKLVVSAFANILTNSSLSAVSSGALYIQASIATSSTLSASVQALANLVSSIQTDSQFLATPFSIGNMECNITPFTELSPQSLSEAVWSAIAIENNNPGTMGEKLNSAGGSNSPTDIADAVWNALKTNYSDTDSMGLLIQEISEELDKRLKKTDFIALK